MTPTDLRLLGEALYGKHWKSPLARRLGVDHNRVWRWSVGRARPSPGYEKALRALNPEFVGTYGPTELAALGEALYGRRWRGALARALGTTWSRVEAWRTGENRPSRRYCERLDALRG